MAQLVAITGEPGAGKTSLIEALVLHKEHIAPYDRQPSARTFLGEGGQQAYFEVESEWLLSPAEQAETASKTNVLVGRSVFRQGHGEVHADPALVHVLARFNRAPKTSKVDLFAESWVGPRKGAPLGDIERWHRVHRLGFGPEKYAGLAPLYVETTPENRTRIAELTAYLCPQLQPSVEELSFTTRYGVRKLAELSLTERLSFELAATIVLVGLEQAVVLFDGLDRAFPRSANHVINTFRHIAPDAQLIVVTDANDILQHADKVITIQSSA